MRSKQVITQSESYLVRHETKTDAITIWNQIQEEIPPRKERNILQTKSKNIIIVTEKKWIKMFQIWKQFSNSLSEGKWRLWFNSFFNQATKTLFLKRESWRRFAAAASGNLERKEMNNPHVWKS